MKHALWQVLGSGFDVQDSFLDMASNGGVNSK